MLDIGRAGCGDRGQERGVEAGDETRELRANPVGKTLRDALRIEASRVALRLRPSRRGGKTMSLLLATMWLSLVTWTS
jgi:hypothetical protein